MEALFSAIIGEQFGIALVIYPITWLIIRRKNGKKLKLDSFAWHFFGWLVTGLGVGIIRYFTIYIVGIQAVIELEKPLLSYSFVFILPILFAIGMSKWNAHFNTIEEATVN